MGQHIGACPELVIVMQWGMHWSKFRITVLAYFVMVNDVIGWESDWRLEIWKERNRKFKSWCRHWRWARNGCIMRNTLINMKPGGPTSVAILRLSRGSFVFEEKAKCLTQSAWLNLRRGSDVSVYGDNDVSASNFRLRSANDARAHSLRGISYRGWRLGSIIPENNRLMLNSN